MAGRWGVGLQGPAAQQHGYGSAAGLAGTTAAGKPAGSLLNPAAMLHRTGSYPGALAMGGGGASLSGADINAAAGGCLMQPVLTGLLPGRGGALPVSTAAMGTAQQASSYMPGSVWVSLTLHRWHHAPA